MILLTQALLLDKDMRQLAEELKGEGSLLLFGRGYNYATALEAALKVKEVALMHRCLSVSLSVISPNVKFIIEGVSPMSLPHLMNHEPSSKRMPCCCLRCTQRPSF